MEAYHAPNGVGSQPSHEGHPTTPNLDNVPKSPKKRKNWVCWKYAYRNGKPTKVPINPYTGGLARSDQPTTWGTPQIAMMRLEMRGTHEDLSGVGYVFSEDDPYVGIDYDDCIDQATGELDPTVAADLEQLNGYAEISPSGTGVKVIVRGKKPGARCKNSGLGVEMYDSRRFFTITGNVLGNYREINEAQEAIEKVYARVFPEQDSEDGAQPREPVVVDMDDKRLLKKARRSEFGNHFRNLYDSGDRSGYPSPSEADFALIRRLAFWTGGDAERMVRLFKESELHRPEKGDGYVERSVRNLLAKYRGSFYEPRKRAKEAEEVLSGELWEAVYGAHWPGMSGPTDHSILISLAMLAMEQGVPKGNGASVRVRREDLAKLAGTSPQTVSASLDRLSEAGWVDVRRYHRRKAQEITLKVPTVLPTRGYTARTCIPSEQNRRQIGQLLRLRWGRSHFAAITRVGKSCGLLAQYLFAAGEDGTTTDDLADITGRRKDNVRNNLRRLVAAGMAVEVGPDCYALPANFWRRLEEELEDSGIATSERLADQRSSRVVEAIDHWRKQPKPSEADNEPMPDPANSPEEQLEVPKNLLAYHADGEIAELERVDDLDEHEQRFAEMEFAAQEVNVRAEKSTPNPETGLEPPTRVPQDKPQMVDNVFIHPPECSCEWCSRVPEPRYAKARSG